MSSLPSVISTALCVSSVLLAWLGRPASSPVRPVGRGAGEGFEPCVCECACHVHTELPAQRWRLAAVIFLGGGAGTLLVGIALVWYLRGRWTSSPGVAEGGRVSAVPGPRAESRRGAFVLTAQ